VEIIETEIRAHCASLTLGAVHVEVAVECGRRYKSAEYGRVVANRIASKVITLRERWNIQPEAHQCASA
jgi:hypothetical protein